MSGFSSPSTTNLLSNSGIDGSIAPDSEPGELEAGRKSAAARGFGNAPEPQGQAGGQMATPAREQSIWEQSAYVWIPETAQWTAERTD